VPKADINGLTIHYQQMGLGPDVVMMHGLCANLAFWYLSVMPALARDFRVTVYDLRGHGYSSMPRYGYTSHDLAADLHALLAHVGIEQAHMVGHSFGGAVGLHYTALHPERVRSLTLADAQIPSLQPALPPRNALRWKRLSHVLRRVGIEVPEDTPRVADGFLEELARLQPWRDTRNAGSWCTAALLGGWSVNSRVVKRWFQLVRTTSAAVDFHTASGLTVECISQVLQPTLAIFGEYSFCMATYRGLKQYLPHCKNVIVPGVGHFHPVLKPEIFVQELRQFILSLEA